LRNVRTAITDPRTASHDPRIPGHFTAGSRLDTYAHAAASAPKEAVRTMGALPE